jgi:hypothetical protein
MLSFIHEEIIMSGSQRSDGDEATKSSAIVRYQVADEGQVSGSEIAIAQQDRAPDDEIIARAIAHRRAMPVISDDQIQGWAKFWSEPSIGRAYSLSVLLTASAMIGCGVESLWSNTRGWRYDVAAAFAVQLVLTAYVIADSFVRGFAGLVNCCFPETCNIPDVRLRDSSLIKTTRADLSVTVLAVFGLIQLQVSDNHVEGNGYYPLLAIVTGLAVLATITAVAIGADMACGPRELTSRMFSCFFKPDSREGLQERLVNSVENSDVEAGVRPSVDGVASSTRESFDQQPAASSWMSCCKR